MTLKARSGGARLTAGLTRESNDVVSWPWNRIGKLGITKPRWASMRPCMSGSNR